MVTEPIIKLITYLIFAAIYVGGSIFLCIYVEPMKVLIGASATHGVPWTITSTSLFIWMMMKEIKSGMCCSCLCWFHALKTVLYSVVGGFFWWVWIINALFFDNPCKKGDDLDNDIERQIECDSSDEDEGDDRFK